MSESERKRRKENNRFSTKINFLAWLVEVETLIKTFSLKICLIEVPKRWLKTFISLKIITFSFWVPSLSCCPFLSAERQSLLDGDSCQQRWAIFFAHWLHFYRPQVNPGSDLWVRMSVRPSLTPWNTFVKTLLMWLWLIRIPTQY